MLLGCSVAGTLGALLANIALNACVDCMHTRSQHSQTRRRLHGELVGGELIYVHTDQLHTIGANAPMEDTQHAM